MMKTLSTPGLVAGLTLMLALVGCSDSTAPAVEGEREPAPTYQAVPTQSLYSLTAGGFSGALAAATADATADGRWCTTASVWFQPAAEQCEGRGQQPPFGALTETEGEIVIVADYSRAAPFAWTGPPERENPFPDEGDFMLDLRMKVDRLGGYGTGLYVHAWNPAGTVGGNSPLQGRVLQIWADTRNVLRATLPGVSVRIGETLAPHSYRLVYEEGAYTLFVDEEYVAGPVASDLRPTAVWLGNPIFVGAAGDWTDFRVSQLTVSQLAEDVVAVPVDVKPGSCPTPLNLRSRGTLPVAITGSAELDVAQVDPSTLRLAGVPVQRYAMEDVAAPVEPFTEKAVDDCSADGADGIMDLTAKFSVEEIADAIAGEVEGDSHTLTLTGNLLPEFGGTPITGEDVVVLKGS